MSSRRISQKKFEEAIRGSGGVIVSIAERLGCCRSTVYKYLKENPKLQEVFDTERERLGDICEQAAIRLINEGHAGMIQFFLKTRYKNRGYADKADIESNGPVFVNINRRVITDEEQELQS